MANNLIVSYDLINPGQRYDKVIAAIKRQGTWAKVHYSLFYLDTSKSAEAVADAIWAAMDANDRLIVVDASNNAAYWYNLPSDVSSFLKEHWRSQSYAA